MGGTFQRILFSGVWSGRRGRRPNRLARARSDFIEPDRSMFLVHDLIRKPLTLFGIMHSLPSSPTDTRQQILKNRRRADSGRQSDRTPRPACARDIPGRSLPPTKTPRMTISPPTVAASAESGESLTLWLHISLWLRIALSFSSSMQHSPRGTRLRGAVPIQVSRTSEFAWSRCLRHRSSGARRSSGN